MLFASYPAGTEIQLHSHDTENHGVITRGELILTIDGKTEKIGVGQWYTVAANVEHFARLEVQTDEVEFWFSVT